jgi:benzodiazapine receptor
MSQSKSTSNIVERFVNTVMGVKDNNTVENNNSQKQEFDGKATFIYIVGTALQITILIITLWAMEQGLTQLKSMNLPSWSLTFLVGIFFTLLSIRSRLFSPLDNTRSKARYNQVIRPNWAPPPLAFPIIWMTIAVLRVISSLWVWEATGQNFLAFPLIIFVIHLAVGDTWNTIFTVEGRLGAAVPVVILGPLLSVIAVTFFYWQTVPKAGILLAPSAIWISIASVLVYSIWQLNGAEPLYPLKREN